MLKLTWLLPLVFSLSAHAALEFDRIEEDTVFFKGAGAPKPLKLAVSNLAFLGELAVEKSEFPYFVLSGVPKAGASKQPKIFIVRPNKTSKPSEFTWPGKIRDPKTGALLMDSRAFFGRCLAGQQEVYVAFQREKVDRRAALQSSVYIAEAQEDHLDERIIERRLPKISTALQKVKAKRCVEIPGKNRSMEARMVLQRAPIQPGDDDDTEEAPSTP